MGTRCPTFELADGAGAVTSVPGDVEGAPALLVGVVGRRRRCVHSLACSDAWESLRDEFAERHGVPWVEIDPGPDDSEGDAASGGDLGGAALLDDGRAVSAGVLGCTGTPEFYVFRAEGRRPLELAWRGHPQAGPSGLGTLRAALEAAITGQAPPPVSAGPLPAEGTPARAYSPWPQPRPSGRGGGVHLGRASGKFVGNYHGDTDFEREEVREEAEVALARQAAERARASSEAAGATSAAIGSTADDWEAFHAHLHASGAFFKDRRYLVGEFPEILDTPGAQGEWIDVLEVGCGSGNSCIPVLGANPRTRLYACDFSAAAVATTAEKVALVLAELADGGSNPEVAAPPPEEQGIRFRAGVCDPVRQDLPRSFSGESATDGFAIAMLIFMLSAVAPNDQAAVLRRVADSLRPGGFVAFRDYGSWDMAMLRFPGAQQVEDRLYLRQDGTLAYFFELEDVEALAASVGLVVEELRWCRIVVTNRKNGSQMRRIFVHAKLRKPLQI